MRIKESTKITISNDRVSEPKQIRFSEEYEDIDVALLSVVDVKQQEFAIGSHTIITGSDSKYVYIKPTDDLTLTFDSGAPITFRGGKSSKLWVNFAALVLITATAQEVTIVCAGE